MILEIQKIRLRKNISQTELANAMGVTPSVVSNWEHETALPRTRDLPALADALGVNIGDLFNPRPCPDHEEYGFN